VTTMIRRAILVAAVVVFAVVGVTVSRHRPASVAAVLGTNDQSPMPMATTGSALTTSWFCPGVPAATDRSTGDGNITVLNPTDTPMSGNLTFFPGEGATLTTALSVPARAQAVVVPRDVAPAAVTGVLVEVYGTNAVVSQTTVTSVGSSTTPCATTASAQWYVAEGTTTIGSTYRLLVLNPFPDDAIVDVSFAADDGPRTPTALQGYVVKARTLRVIDVAAAVQRDTLVSASVVARNGRVVVGRFQSIPYAPRKGFIASLAESSGGSQWWFANGQKGDGVDEQLVLYNPFDDDTSANVTIFPSDPTKGTPVPLTYSVPSHQRVAVDVASTDQVPAGSHSIMVTTDPDRPVVAERVIDITTKDRDATTVQAGSRVAAARWYVPIGAPAGGSNVLTLVNVTGVDTSFGVDTLGAAGETPMGDLQNVQLPAGASLQVPLQDHGAAGQPVVVSAEGQVVVEQSVLPPTGSAGGWSSLGVPVK
jgi:Family of unknown function (DUF5719)